MKGLLISKFPRCPGPPLLFNSPRELNLGALKKMFGELQNMVYRNHDL